jgi:hypothetical protein
MSKKSVFLAGASIVGAALLATAGYAAAQDSGPPAGTGAGHEFVCAHLSEIQKLQADHLTFLGDRLGLLNEAKSAAEQSGNTKAADRITTRIGRVTDRQTKVTDRQQKVAETCTAG